MLAMFANEPGGVSSSTRVQIVLPSSSACWSQYQQAMVWSARSPHKAMPRKRLRSPPSPSCTCRVEEWGRTAMLVSGVSGLATRVLLIEQATVLSGLRTQR